MQYDFWASRWQEGKIGFHLDRPNPTLERHWPELVSGPGSVLVPLCGKSHDLDWLARRGHDVFGVEFVEQAVQCFFEERGILPERREAGPVAIYEQGPMHLICGDFFQLQREHVEPCDWVYDRAAVVALEPSMRRKYLEKLHSMTKEGAGLLLINFVHDIGSGPPFSISDAELVRLLDGLFAAERIEERDVLRHEPRFAERGATHMLEQVWFGRRLP